MRLLPGGFAIQYIWHGLIPVPGRLIKGQKHDLVSPIRDTPYNPSHKNTLLNVCIHTPNKPMSPTMCWTIPNQSRRQSDPASPTTLEQSDEIESIVTVTKGFLSALGTKSRDDFDKYCVRAGGMALWPPPPEAPRFCTIGAFIEHISKIKDDINERIWDPEVKVDGLVNLAAVWAPFRAKINGVVDHVGVELFILHKINGEWKVTGLADSCRQPTEEEKSTLV